MKAGDAPAKLDRHATRDVLARAYVPEHVPGLMATLSSGQPHLVDDHLVLRGEHGVILVGYPLDDRFEDARIDEVVRRLQEAWRPERLLYVGPRLPASLQERARDVEADRYYLLDVEHAPPARLLRIAEKARARLEVREESRLGEEHGALIDAFRTAVALPEAVDRLYASMPQYVDRCPTASVLVARDEAGALAALFLIERGAEAFDAYLLGCRALEASVPHASDVLMAELIERARRAGKVRVDLGLGVNDGIRRFKEKWGGAPDRPYVACTCELRRPSPFSLLRHLWGSGP